MKKLLILLLLIPNLVMAESPCVEGDCLNGQGTKILSNGDKYVGQYKDGTRHGQGTYTFNSLGHKYVGQYKDGKMNGQGTYFLSDGSKWYEGQWKDGKMHGQGTKTEKGQKYVGQLKDSKKHGQGTMIVNAGNKYVGQWKDDKIHGQGTLTYNNGDKYVGEFKDDKMHGQGTYFLSDGRKKYEGEWKDNRAVKTKAAKKKRAKKQEYPPHWIQAKRQKEEEMARYCAEVDCVTKNLENGRKYVGGWKDGAHGKGTYYEGIGGGGEIYIGGWKDGKMHGKGINFMRNGWMYEASRIDGEEHGRGILTREDGEKQYTEFKDSAQANKKSNVQNRGYELACEGYPPPNSPHKLLSIDCNNRKIFIGTLKDSWLLLRRGGIGGTLENLCYEAYTDAKELHPSISFLSVSESFLMRCNMGLAYLQD